MSLLIARSYRSGYGAFGSSKVFFFQKNKNKLLFFLKSSAHGLREMESLKEKQREE